MRTFKICMRVIFFLVISISPAYAAEAEIEKALLQLFDNNDISVFLMQSKSNEIQEGAYQVRPGDTLDAIIQLAYGRSAIRKDVLRQAFVSLNPSAFRNANPNWLLSGATLKIPMAEDIQSMLFVDYSTVRDRYPVDTRSWVRYP